MAYGKKIWVWKKSTACEISSEWNHLLGTNSKPPQPAERLVIWWNMGDKYLSDWWMYATDGLHQWGNPKKKTLTLLNYDEVRQHVLLSDDRYDRFFSAPSSGQAPEFDAGFTLAATTRILMPSRHFQTLRSLPSFWRKAESKDWKSWANVPIFGTFFGAWYEGPLFFFVTHW